MPVTVCKANVPEMITEDYLSDMEEGIFPQIFNLHLCVSLTFTLSFHIFVLKSGTKPVRSCSQMLGNINGCHGNCLRLVFVECVTEVFSQREAHTHTRVFVEAHQ